jgi:solute carrier family 7 (L-type amino acid transporter), member 9/15
MLEPFSYIHTERKTPIPSVILQGILSLFFLLAGNIEALIDFASFLIWFFYGCAFIALLVMRKTHSHLPRSYRVPTLLPYFMIFVSLFLVITPIASDPNFQKYLSALGFILSGFFVYIPFVYYKKRPKIVDKITFLIQTLFVVIPCNEKKDEDND